MKIFFGQKNLGTVLLVSALLVLCIAPALAAESWTVDAKTGCRICLISSSYTLAAASWSGAVVDGKAEGKGKLTLTLRDKDGKEITGKASAEMKQGKLDGNVKLQWSNGESYEGSFREGKMDGRGILKFSNGNSYEGDFKEGKKDGKGIYKLKNGEVYEGDFVNDQAEGQGVYRRQNGEIIEGVFKKGSINGKGIYKFTDGRVYQGEWRNGERVGPFVPLPIVESWAVVPKTGCRIGWLSDVYTLTEASWSGQAMDGKAEGKGKLTLTLRDQAGEVLTCKGTAEMKQGKLNGNADLQWSDGSSFLGVYRDGKKDGFGILKYKNGDIYHGEFKDGLRSGNGVLKKANGESYEGGFKDDFFDGKGVLKRNNGDSYEGDFQNDYCKGKGVYRWKNGNVYEGDFDERGRNGYGVLKDSTGKIIYQGFWMNDQVVSTNSKEKFVSI
ncbi:MAG: hypothetical protein ACM3YE_11995 [Bacteroidota bacterium]